MGLGFVRKPRSGKIPELCEDIASDAGTISVNMKRLQDAILHGRPRD